MTKRVLVAMSGGVDSAVAAALLQEAGYHCTGVTLKLFDQPADQIPAASRSCCSLTDIEDARQSAYKLGMEHFVFNYTRPFQQQVIQRFADTYAAGQTPNPCIDCNRFVKIPLVLQRALELGYDYIATGHYARISQDQHSGRYLLHKAADAKKDQSYVLYALTQPQLAHLLLPLGDLDKSQTRQLAQEFDLRLAEKAESQDICFVPDGDYARFLTQKMHLTATPGNIIDLDGNLLGRHNGLLHYTVGQRKGLNLQAFEPYYVVHKDAVTNTLVVGKQKQNLSSGLYATDLSWLAIAGLQEPLAVKVKTRSHQSETAAMLYPLANGDLEVRFNQPQPPAAPGQAIVFYQDDLVVGGGTIRESLLQTP